MAHKDEVKPFLTVDEEESFREILTHDGWRVLIKVFQSQVELQERRVLDFNLAVKSVNELAFEKARLEGARQLFNSIRALKGRGKSDK